MEIENPIEENQEVETTPEAEKEEEKKEQEKAEECAELKDKYLRLYAEFENYKKRMQKDKEQLLKYSNEDLILEILPSVDHLEIALKHKEERNGLIEGVEMTLRELLRTLEKFGLKRMETLGKEFDPQFHDAMAIKETEDSEEGIVLEEMRSGYIYKDKVIRPALVCVSKRPKKEEIPQENAEEES